MHSFTPQFLEVFEKVKNKMDERTLILSLTEELDGIRNTMLQRVRAMSSRPVHPPGRSRSYLEWGEDLVKNRRFQISEMD